MRRIFRLTGAIVSILSIIAYIYILHGAFLLDEFRNHLSGHFGISFLIASILYGFTIPAGAFGWKYLLSGMGIESTLYKLSAIALVTQLGKYVPGNIGQLVGRTAMTMKIGLPPAGVVASIAYETALLLLVGVLFGFGAASLSGYQFGHLIESRIDIIGFAVAALIVAVAVIGVVVKIVLRLDLSKFTYLRGAYSYSFRPSKNSIVVAVAMYGLSYLTVGASAMTVASAIYPQIDTHLLQFVSAMSIAWIAGFVTPGAPAGIGIREILLTLMMGPSIGMHDASVFALIFRMVTISSDILCFVTGVLMMTSGRFSMTASGDQ